ncbi:MAG: EamA family transporter RarD, partial [Asticcacaulis sp.]
MSSSTPPHSGSVFASPTFMAALCYAIWGLVPLFYLPIHAFGAGAIEIIAHRSLWAALCAGGLVLANRQGADVMAIVKAPRLRWMLLLSSIMIASNWGVYVWAVTSSHTVETALGYYLTPLLNMAAGSLLFHERLDNWGKGA